MAGLRTRVGALGALAVLAACSTEPTAPEPQADPAPTRSSAPTTPTPDPVVFPGQEWDRAERGDFTDLDADLAAAGSSCVAVVQDGRLVHDGYWNGGAEDEPVRTYSITKSLTALLVDAAVGDGVLALDDSASEQVDEWRTGPAGDVTVRDLLAMTSGRQWSEATDRQLIRGSADQTGYAVGLPQAAAPGEWVYDNSAPQVLERVLAESATEDGDVVGLAQRTLFDVLGMDDTQWPRDGAGQATTYSGVRSTCHDLARIGHLMLTDGAWDGEQVVPTGVVDRLTNPATDQNAAYGLLWWTNAEGRVVEVRRQAGFADDVAPYEGRLAPNAPADAFWAFGYGNQYVAVVPSENLVAVRLGARPPRPDQVTFDTFTAGVLDALD